MPRTTTKPTTAMDRICFPVIFFLLFHAAQVLGDAGSPFFAPLFGDDVCKSIDCGKGTCKASSINPLIPFVCECQHGWKRLINETGTEFMPCVIPNCTVDFSCDKSSSPPPVSSLLPNSSSFDPCTFAYCGEGTCVKNSTFGYTCECKEGSANLMKSTNLPCLTKCYLGADCSIPIGSPPPSTSSTITSPSSGTADLGLSRSMNWLITSALVGLMFPVI